MTRTVQQLLGSHTTFVVCGILLVSFVVEHNARAAPELAHDSLSETPFDRSYAERRQAYLDLHRDITGGGPFVQAVRLELGLDPNEPALQPVLDEMDAREDCADFGMHGILRILYQFGDSPLLTDAFREHARQSILHFKYWPDEPGIDSMCTWSENHHILFASGGYLAGQLYPNAVFTNSGQTGRDKMAICRPRVLRWLEFRYRTGFSEWLSNVYYDEDLAALLNLVDFCDDPEIARKAAMVTDLLLADIALNSYRGIFGSTHGRSYERHKKWPARESTASVAHVLFGMNEISPGHMSTTSLALSTTYRVPRVLVDIATDLDRPEMLNRQRIGIRIEDAEKWGLDFDRLEDGMTFLSFEAYGHPKVIPLMLRMMDEYNWWENDFFEGFHERKDLIDTARRWNAMPLIAWYYRKDLTRNMRTEVNTYTYRTPDYMLSSAQDYRRGYGGDQQHIWQATLGPDVVCFTTHPAQYGNEEVAYGSPGYWTGSGSLPRVAQIENTAIIVYNISTKPGLYLTHKLRFTHAWLPKDQFDEVREEAGWVFARKEDAYLALWSQQPTRWQDKEGDDKDRELIADGKKNIWICELGRRATDGTFEEFRERIATARIETRGLRVRYDSPSQGKLTFGWHGPLRKNGKAVSLNDYPRFGNPYTEAPFPGNEITFHHNEQSLHLNWQTLERQATAFCQP